jgi:DNA-binding SARP family transcriptional activator
MTSMTDGWTFALLGPVSGSRDGTGLRLGSPQQRAVLAALLLHEGRQVGLDQLIGALWGEDPPRSAAGTVRTYVFRLRAAIGEDGHRVLGAVGGGYALRVPAEATDVVRFHRLVAEAGRLGPAEARLTLRSAAQVWTGTALAGVPGPYAQAQRDRLIELRTEAAERAVALDVELGRYAEGLAELAVLIATHPLRERLRELRMLALHRSGRTAEALATYREMHRLLVGELGIGPGPGLRRAHELILSGIPAAA